MFIEFDAKFETLSEISSKGLKNNKKDDCLKVSFQYSSILSAIFS